MKDFKVYIAGNCAGYHELVVNFWARCFKWPKDQKERSAIAAVVAATAEAITV